MTRRLKAFLWLAVLALGLSPAGLQAHNKSLSFSNFIWAGESLSVSFTAPARDVTLLPNVQTSDTLSDALAAHVSQFLRLSQMNIPG